MNTESRTCAYLCATGLLPTLNARRIPHLSVTQCYELAPSSKCTQGPYLSASAPVNNGVPSHFAFETELDQVDSHSYASNLHTATSPSASLGAKLSVSRSEDLCF